MSCNFSGISPEAIMLLMENRFNDSKSFYDENKDKLKRGILIPVAELVADITPTILKINPDIIVNPTRIISRIRRDTRFTKNKMLYRENIWFALRHQKNELPTPCFWFEFFPDRYSYGCGVMSASPSFMRFWRQQIVEQSPKLLRAAKLAEAAGFVLDSDSYKRSKAVDDRIDGKLARWYDLKEIYMTHTSGGIARLNQPQELVDELCAAYNSAAPMYKFLLSLTERFNTAEI